MDLKLYLNKFLKVDNIEYYTLESLYSLRKCYDNFIEKSKGKDPDFPMMNFGDPENTYKAKNNITRLDIEQEESRGNSMNSDGIDPLI